MVYRKRVKLRVGLGMGVGMEVAVGNRIVCTFITGGWSYPQVLDVGCAAYKHTALIHLQGSVLSAMGGKTVENDSVRASEGGGGGAPQTGTGGETSGV